MENSEFYLVVEDIFEIAGKGIVVIGWVQGGSIEKGNKIVVVSRLFENKNCTVLGIEKFNKLLKIAYPGDYIGVTLSHISKKDIHKKDILKKI
ncbi:MAG: EF-Tu/IF-2/RF-3 family GTPase [Candidatus Omnitrophota bacterium]